MVAASLICSGILSALQMTRFKIPFTRNIYFGTGLITVVGTSFASLSTASSIFNALYADGTCPMVQAADGTMIKGACPEAFGYLLGTSALCSLLEMGMAFVPPRVLKKIFPPIITGTVIMLIGAKLIKDSGFVNWAGGSNNCRSRPTTGIFALCPTIYAPHPLKWGSAEFLGLGFLSFATILIVELFGSPFMKNASIMWVDRVSLEKYQLMAYSRSMGLIVGMIVAGPTGYVDGSSIKSAPAITFLWVSERTSIHFFQC